MFKEYPSDDDEERVFLQKKVENNTENDVEKAAAPSTVYQELQACLDILLKAKRRSFTNNNNLNAFILSGLSTGASAAGITYFSINLAQVQAANLSWRKIQIGIQQALAHRSAIQWSSPYALSKNPLCLSETKHPISCLRTETLSAYCQELQETYCSAGSLLNDLKAMGANDPHSTILLIIFEVIFAILITISLILLIASLTKLIKQTTQNQFYLSLNKEDQARIDALYEKLGLKINEHANVDEMHKELFAIKEKKDKCFAFLLNAKRESSPFGLFFKQDGGNLTRLILKEAGLSNSP